MRMDPEMVGCGNPWVWSSFEYGGVLWRPIGALPASWGPRGPWRGSLTIIGKIPKSRPPSLSANGYFEYHGAQVPLYGGPGIVSTGPIC